MNRVIQPNESRETVKREVCAFIDLLEADRPWLVDITRLVKKRTNLQNSALWGCAYKIMAQESGFNDQRIHELMCGEFFGWKVIDMFGNKKRVPERTTTHDEDGNRDVITTVELIEFYERIQAFAAEWSIDIPKPDPKWNLK